VGSADRDFEVGNTEKTICLDKIKFRCLNRCMLATLQIVQSPEKAGVLLQPGRLRLLEQLTQPDSAAGLARRLGVPRQKLNYHLRELERAGFVELFEERRKGNCTERVVRATAREFLVAPHAGNARRILPRADCLNRAAYRQVSQRTRRRRKAIPSGHSVLPGP
jgi:DNA-binding transcriptional ArsR family regulator